MDTGRLLTAVFLLILPISGFLFTDDDCVAPPMCSCAGPTITCSDRRMPRIPHINMTNHYNTLYLHLQNNHIIVVPADSFTGLNCDHLYLDLSSNSMRGIHVDAFSGIENNVTILKLEHNFLSSIPIAVANMSNLIILDVHDNPIKTFDANVMEPLGEHLDMFYVGSSVLEHWPTEFNLLKHLKAFYLYDIQMAHIPHRAFKGFEATLQRLNVYNTTLTGVPNAICFLSQLTYLYFANNTYIHQDKILPTCKHVLNTVNRVSIDNNNLTSFPDVFTLFPKLTTLSVSYNPELESIDVNISQNTFLRGLSLRNNAFNEIPLELENFINLLTLDIHANNISALHDGDFEELEQLTVLDLSNNPIQSIENEAFSNMSALYHITLDNVPMSEFPVAITDLENIRTIDFRNNYMNCSCEAMGWLKNWTYTHNVVINGECTEPEVGEPISTFLALKLPRC